MCAEDRSHTLLQLVAVLQEAAVIVAPHGTQVYNAVLARPATVLIELAALTTQFRRPDGQGLSLSLCLSVCVSLCFLLSVRV